MCFYWQEINTVKKNEELTVREISRIMSTLPTLYQITITGGEPMLRKDLAEIITTIHQTAHPSRVTIPTNGYFPEQTETLANSITDQFPDKLLSINLSIDGVGELHNRIRGTQDSFERMLETYDRLRLLQKKRPNLAIATATVVTKENFPFMDPLLTFVEHRMDIHSHGLMLARGNVRDASTMPTDTESFIALLEKLYHKTCGSNSLNNALAEAYLHSRVSTLRQQQMFDPCLAGRKLIVINEVGTVLPCEILPAIQTDHPHAPKDFIMGHLRDVDYNVPALLATPKAKEILQFIQGRNCWCTFECAQINNFVLNPLTYPRILRRMLMNKLTNN
ncbi:MAG: radical SAM protein [Magnetococcales bacterium]|nr:radical SAM protein [Magnetococcales bacterium]